MAVEQTPEQVALIRQQQTTKVLMAISVGRQLLTDETVVAPIKYADGIAALKWLLNQLLNGQFAIDFNPQQTAAMRKERPGGEGLELVPKIDGKDKD